MPAAITHCRICRNPTLEPLLSLGNQYLTGRFPRSAEQPLLSGPLELVKCCGSDGCGLVQLRHNHDLAELYGHAYGYRSSLNRSMVQHLRWIVSMARAAAPLAGDDLVLDIGSNDGTLLSFYPRGRLTLVGMDPTAAQFRSMYRDDIIAIDRFFSADEFLSRFPGRRARNVTSIAMFYDLEAPLEFVQQVAQVLDDDGIWITEQSYLPAMLQATAYDNICHEHLEYYALRQIKWMADQAGLNIAQAWVNDVNGGSIGVVLTRRKPSAANADEVEHILAQEQAMQLDTLQPYADFARRVDRHRSELVELLHEIRSRGQTVLGYGASTKGNVLLQYCGIGRDLLPAIAEVNASKFGCVTPGTGIPIISEPDAHQMKPDYFLVLPWHFRTNLVERESAFLAAGGKMIFPLPQIEVVGA